ncbi:MAG: hypothetical protein JWQ73_4049 [Variovorax sp.]|nr:hypothetical protein [Variovorax sp.]
MQGHYINLDRSTDRRQAMQRRLDALGLTAVRRFSAVDGRTLDTKECPLSASETACFMSHAQVIAQPASDTLRMVLEDDTLLADSLPAALAGLDAAPFADCHLVFLDCQPYLALAGLVALYQGLQTWAADRDDGRPGRLSVFDARGLYHWGANAYLVTPRGQRELPAMLAEALREGPALPFDLWLGERIGDGRIAARVLAPFLAAPALGNHENSTMADRDPQDVPRAFESGTRALFFVDADLDALERFMRQELGARRTDDRRLRLLAAMAGEMTVHDFVLAARPK